MVSEVPRVMRRALSVLYRYASEKKQNPPCPSQETTDRFEVFLFKPGNVAHSDYLVGAKFDNREGL